MAILLTLLEAAHAAPPASSSAQGKISFPADFVPQAADFDDQDAEGQDIGLTGVRGRPLKERNGTRAIYIVSAPEGDQSLKAGDVITAMASTFLKDDPIATFKKGAEWLKRKGLSLTFSRVRNGENEQVTIRFGGPQIPNLTDGGKPNPGEMSWNLGATGAKGWIWAIPHKSTEGAKQIYITKVDPKSPASHILKPGDVILGAEGKTFRRDARKEMVNAITAAETPEKKGKLALTVWNAGKTREVTLTLKVMGHFSEAPATNDVKSKQIIDAGCVHLLKAGLGDGVRADVNALGLLATGREDVMPMVREHAQKVAAGGKNLPLSYAKGTWNWGYHNLFLTEYYLATKDETVLPAILEYSTKMSMGQSVNGNWAHSMCVPYPFSDGTLHGICPGYGAMNQASLPCMISLALAGKCGVTNEHIEMALKRGGEFFRFYVDRGAVPYGDHSPQSESHEDNGKCSLTAVMFDLMGDQEAATFFTKLAIASYNEREGGHTGNYFSLLWGPLGAARGGDAAAAAFMKRMEWFYDFERQWGGKFEYQGKPGMVNNRSKENQYYGWDCTGARLLAYCLPLKKLYITGKGRVVKDITGQALTEAVEAGALSQDDYSRLSTQELLVKLESLFPAVRSRAAQALENRPDNVVPQLIAMLDSPNRYARYGACQGLRVAGRASVEAADAIIAKGLESSDEVMLFYAMRAFGSYSPEMGLSTHVNRALPVMLAMATPEDPRKLSMRTKNELAFALFYSGNAQKVKAVARKGEGIPQADSELVVKAVRELLKVENGGSRSSVSAVYDKLTEEQLKLLWKAIYGSVREMAPADIMFSSGARTSGLKLMASHHTREGLETAVWYLTNQKGHNVVDATQGVLGIIINGYGGHAKSVIPQLEKAAKYLEEAYMSKDAADKVRDAIKTIEKAPTPEWQMTSIAEYLK